MPIRCVDRVDQYEDPSMKTFAGWLSLPFVCEHRFGKTGHRLDFSDNKIPQFLAFPVFSIDEEWIQKCDSVVLEDC
jgi:hypothetical protein